MGFVRQSKYIFPWILRFIFGKKQEYFWIPQKYIEISVSNPPNDLFKIVYCLKRNLNIDWALTREIAREVNRFRLHFVVT